MKNETSFKEDVVTLRRRRIVSVASIIIFVAFFAFVFFYIGGPMIKFVKDPEQFRMWVDSHGVWGKVAFFGMTLLQIIVAIIPGEPLEICAGYAFGIIEGTVLCMLGILVGSTLIWLFSHYLGIKAVEAFYPRKKLDELKFLKNTDRLNVLTFILFFIPGTPKDMLSYFIGLTPMKLHTFLIIVCIARIPSVITSVIGGSALMDQNYIFAVIFFGLTGILSLTGIIVYKKKFGKKKTDSQCDDEIQKD